MIIQRINYHQRNPGAINALASANKHITSIDKKLRALIELRVSQINGCAYCVDLHSQQARAEGEDQQRIDCLAVWQESPFFNKAECAALAWAESLTQVSVTRAPNNVYEALQQHYSEQQIVDMTLVISTMNMWNRIAIGMRRLPDRRA
jgi:AhpD family alkylhydroperoxidase